MIRNEGGCHCQQFRFYTEFDPLLIVQCSCQSCRKLLRSINFGTLFGEDEVTFKGETKTYEYLGGSGLPMVNYNCPNCSSICYRKGKAFEGLVGIPLGAYDNPQKFEPNIEIWTSQKLPWLRDNGCIKESFEDSGLMQRIEAMMVNMDQRG